MIFRRLNTSLQTDMKLVVGLGNIGREYVNTRHNIGFEVADELARRFLGQFRSGKFKGEQTQITVNGLRVLLLKPHTLMNLSGEAVLMASRFYKIPPENILVICDDVYLPLGKLRLRAKGSDGGHNGLWSIIHRLGTDDFVRLRIGVDSAPPGMDMAVYVLGKFLAREQPVINEARDSAAGAVETWITQGVEAAMNKWNAQGG